MNRSWVVPKRAQTGVPEHLKPHLIIAAKTAGVLVVHTGFMQEPNMGWGLFVRCDSGFRPDEVKYLGDKKLKKHRWCNFEGTLGQYVNCASGEHTPNAQFEEQDGDDEEGIKMCTLVATRRISNRQQILLPNYVDKY